MKETLGCSSVIFISLLSLALSQTLDAQWHSWKALHSKVYSDPAEESTRRDVWLDNWARVETHNRGNHSFNLGLNHLADMSDHEIRKYYLMQDVVEAKRNRSEVTLHHHSSLISYPEKWDWREKGFVTGVYDQKRCKASWAFAAAGATEGQHARTRGELVSLSVQQLIDCSWKYGSQGCSGGTPSKAFMYIVENGLCSLENYPFLGFMWHCMAQYCGRTASAVEERMVRPQNETDLLDALYHVGPVSVMMDASSYSFLFYDGGVYSDDKCSSEEESLNHAMLLVGYVDYVESNSSYWILKNSWGASWGDSGYMMLTRGQNTCGVATLATYAV